MLDAQYFGVPQKRRRLFLVAGLGRYPSADFLADAGSVESLPASPGTSFLAKPADAWAGYTLGSPNKLNHQSSRISMGSELLVAQENGWSAMAQRAREVEIHGLPRGLGQFHLEQASAAGNAVVPAMAKWIAEILNRS